MSGWPTTIDGMAEKILRSITAYYRSEFTTLASNELASAGTFTVQTGHAAAMNLQIGDIIETGAELHLITAIATDTLTVENAWLGTTAAAHATDDMVRIHPRVGRQDVYDALESVVMSWDDLWKVNSYTATANFGDDGDRSAEILLAPAGYKRLLKTLFKGDDNIWKPAGKEWVVRDVPDVTSGLVLQWEVPWFERDTDSNTVTVYLAEYFDTSTWAAATDLVIDIELERSMLDVLYYGALFFLLMPEETQRASTDAQAQPRDADEVPPGYLAQTALSFKVLHDQRKATEAAKLAERWKAD
jgi:hypothetical protein